MPNRIILAIERARRALASSACSSTDLARAEKAAALTFTEWRTMQDRRAAAQAGGVLSVDESQTLYAILGGSPTAFAGNGLAERIVTIKALTELMARDYAAA